MSQRSVCVFQQRRPAGNCDEGVIKFVATVSSLQDRSIVVLVCFNKIQFVGFDVLKTAVVWDDVPCSLVDIYRLTASIIRTG